MNNDINAKLNSILSKLSHKDLQKIMQMANKSGFASKLTPAEKERLLNEFSKLNSNDINQKLSRFNPSDLSNLSIDELIKKIHNL